MVVAGLCWFGLLRAPVLVILAEVLNGADCKTLLLALVVTAAGAGPLTGPVDAAVLGANWLFFPGLVAGAAGFILLLATADALLALGLAAPTSAMVLPRLAADDVLGWVVAAGVGVWIAVCLAGLT